MSELKLVRVVKSDGRVFEGELISVTVERDDVYAGYLCASLRGYISVKKEYCEVITDEVEIESLIAEYNLTTESSVYLSVTEDYPKLGVEGIGYSKDWIDEDSCPNGTRACFRVLNLEDEIQWYTASWDVCNNAYSCESEWHQNLKSTPTHFMATPSTKYLK